MQPDDKIVIVGETFDATASQSKFAVARLNPNGALDTSFGSGTGTVALALGATTNSATALSAVIQADGKIVVAGYYDLDFAIVRLNGDGSLDDTFATGGIYLSNVGGTQSFVSALALASQPSGGQMIIYDGGTATGSSSGNFLRGFVDSTGQFPTTSTVPSGPYANNAFFAMTQQGNKFVMVGASLSNADPYPGTCSTRRYALRPTGLGNLEFFDDASFTPLDFQIGGPSSDRCLLQSVGVLPDGDLIVAGIQTSGQTTAPFAMGLHGSDGSMNGLLINQPFTGAFGDSSIAVIQADGKVLLIGTTLDGTYGNMIVQRRNWQIGNVQLDASYANAGTAQIDFSSAGIHTNSIATAGVLDQFGRLIIVGASQDIGSKTEKFAVARLQGDVIFTDGFEQPI
jgi:uncharacterized delta-60 repeat protein